MTMRIIRAAALLILLPVLAQAQNGTRPTAFLGLKWGATRGEVLTLLKKQGAAVPEEDPGLDKLVVEGGTFAGQDVMAWAIDFASGKLMSAAVTMKPAESGTSLYRDMKQQLISKYGPHSGERKLAGTIEERRARVASGLPPKRGTAVTWKFAPTLHDKNTLSIVCEVTPGADYSGDDEAQFLVTLRYTDETLKAQVLAAAAAAAAGVDDATVARPVRPVKADCL